jgi:hypothetical protein
MARLNIGLRESGAKLSVGHSKGGNTNWGNELKFEMI